MSDAFRPCLLEILILNQLYAAVLLELIFIFPTCVHQVVRDETIQEAPVVEVFNETLRHTRAWFRNALSQKLLTEFIEHVAFSFYKEPEVCHLLIIRIKMCFTVP